MLMNQMSEEGGALAETALSMSFLVLLLLGAVEFGGWECGDSSQQLCQSGSPVWRAEPNHRLRQPGNDSAHARNEYFDRTALSLDIPNHHQRLCVQLRGYRNTVSCSINSVTSPACPGSVMEVTITVQTQASFDPLFTCQGFRALHPDWDRNSEGAAMKLFRT